MLVLEAAWPFGGGLVLFALAIAADVLAHLAGWHALERPVHLALVLGMVVTLFGVLLRGLRSTAYRKEHLDAHR